jgi:hypothetical protein
MNKPTFSAEYSELSDDELLQVASDRSSLTEEAAAALHEELQRRNLTKSDLAKYQQFVKQRERREKIRRRRKIVGTRSDPSSWVDAFWILLAIALISYAYIALPSRYHMRPDWEDAALVPMITSVSIAVLFRSWWKQMSFWFSCVLSWGIHMFLVHDWIQHAGKLNRGYAKLAMLLGLVQFLVIYGLVWLLRRYLNGEEAPHPR